MAAAAADESLVPMEHIGDAYQRCVPACVALPQRFLLGWESRVTACACTPELGVWVVPMERIGDVYQRCAAGRRAGSAAGSEGGRVARRQTP